MNEDEMGLHSAAPNELSVVDASPSDDDEADVAERTKWDAYYDGIRVDPR